MTTNNLTLFAALTKSATQLTHAWEGVFFSAPPNAKCDAQILLAHTLQKPVAYLFAHGEELLLPEQEALFFSFIERRAQHEPIAFITGTKAFFGRDFCVTHDTLIPRPETELLVETALARSTPQTLIVDIGTGSGAIGLTLAAETPCPVVAIDISPAALNIAQKNAQQLNVIDRVHVLQGNLLMPFFPVFVKWPTHFPINHLLLCANLPYLTKNQWEALNPNVKNFEPKSALIGGYTGLELYDELLMQIKAKRNVLPKNITLLCEIDPSQKEKLPRIIAAHFPSAQITLMNDIAHLPRLVIAHV